MKSQLGVKILLALLTLTLLSLALSGLAINWAVNRQFESYIEDIKTAENLRIVDVVSAYYAERGHWGGIAPNLTHIGMSTETIIVLKDAKGSLVYDSRIDMRGIMGTIRRMDMQQRVRLEQEGESFTYPVTVDGMEVGSLTLTLLGREGLLAQEDLDFSQTINYSIILIAALAALMAIATSIFLSRRLTLPLEEITRAVKTLREGDLSRRVQITSQDELGLLGTAFNAMAIKLENTEKMRRKLSADISHELRTPLTTLKSYLEAFKEGVLAPTEENITSLQEEVARLERLVQSLQELSLAENRAADLPPKKLNPGPTLKRIFDLYQPLFSEKRLSSDLKLPRDEVTLYCNEEALERILHNLLSNAIKYSPQGGEVQVTLDREGGQGEAQKNARIIVSDTGPGIKEKDLPFIFERFYRVDPSRSRRTGGAGIGLTIVKELAQAQGGSITVASRVGEGSKFILTLPLAVGAPSEMKAKT